MVITKQLILRTIQVPLRFIAAIFYYYESAVERISSVGALVPRTEMINRFENEIFEVVHVTDGRQIRFKMFCPNFICKFRGVTFSTKEVETLRWVEMFCTPDSTFFDIGANVGIYTMYAVALSDCEVVAFEPSPSNVGVLARNIAVNEFDDKVTLINCPLSTTTSILNLEFIPTVGAAFDTSESAPRQISTNVRTMAVSLDDLFKFGVLHTPPTLVKIDVDGVELEILKGGEMTLSNSQCQSVIIEISTSFGKNGSEVRALLKKFGFLLRGSFFPMESLVESEDSRMEIWSRP